MFKILLALHLLTAIFIGGLGLHMPALPVFLR